MHRYLVAAFTGLRLGGLLGLRWDDVDFDAATIRVRRNWTDGREGTPRNGRDRAVPVMDDVARSLAQLGQRDRFTGDHDLVFCDHLGRHLGYKTLRARYKAALERASLRQLRFHDLRHTSGTHAIRAADPLEVIRADRGAQARYGRAPRRWSSTHPSGSSAGTARADRS